MGRARQDATELQEHVAATYRNLRLGIGLIGAMLPVVLWLGGRLFDHHGLMGSMSAYYYSPSMRDTLVGALVLIGVFLYLYKGFSPQENRALNIAGVLAVAAALDPTNVPGTPRTPRNWLHIASAIGFFLAIAYVAVFCSNQTLSLIRDPEVEARYRRLYRTLGGLMIASPLTAVLTDVLLRARFRGSTIVFWLEAFGIWSFAAFWLTKSHELATQDVDRRAMEATLRMSQEPSAAAATGGRGSPPQLVQIAPVHTEYPLPVELAPPGPTPPPRPRTA